MSAYFDLDEHFKTTAARDVAALLLGECLGYGTYRAVYKHALDDDLIVKVENGERCFSNVIEYEVWNAVKETEFAKWFAPVVACSPTGTVLIMRKTLLISERELPAKVPSFFTDLKADNFGRLDGRIVCHDYGNNLLMEKGMSKRMRKADWNLYHV
jgi:hypothetical protein